VSFKITGGWSGATKEIVKDLDRRLKNAGVHIGREISDKTAREVQRRLQGSGWIRIYRDAIIYQETVEGDEWAVAGLSERDDLFEHPADKSLATFSNTGVGKLMEVHNPWTIDTIPGAYYRGTTITVRPASEGEVERFRAARIKNLPSILAKLEANNVRVLPDGLPVAGDGIYADIAYLARRLELGYPGFSRVAHWGPAASNLKSSGNTWLGEPRLIRLVESAVKGREPKKVAQMTRADAEKLAKIRESTWP